VYRFSIDKCAYRSIKEEGAMTFSFSGELVKKIMANKAAIATD